jgi:hypothetical protein
VGKWRTIAVRNAPSWDGTAMIRVAETPRFMSCVICDAGLPLLVGSSISSVRELRSG